MIRYLTALSLSCAAPAVAQDAFSLEFPLDCDIGETCFIQQYVDNDPGPGQADFACGVQANDGHKGTDIRVASWAEMRAGIDVLASAPGKVRATRDGMQDIPANAPNAPDIDGRECGNAVVVDHPQGWQTTYCHLKRGSVMVRAGDKITTGQVLGQIGASGSTHFPHLHLTVRRDDEVIDPFRPDPTQSCTSNPEETLWTNLPSLEFGGLLSAGFATKVPDFDAIKDGPAPIETLSPDAPALVIWAFLFATRTGDTLTLSIVGPDDWSYETSETFEKGQAQLFRAGGRKQPESGFPQGSYTATVTHSRDGTSIDTLEITLEIKR